jgi:hypothetical protein
MGPTLALAVGCAVLPVGKPKMPPTHYQNLNPPIHYFGFEDNSLRV